MSLRPGVRDVFWLAGGGAALLAITLLALHFRDQPGAADVAASRGPKLELVDQMRVALASAAANGQGAVLGASDEEAVRFADATRAALGDLDQRRQELAGLLAAEGEGREPQVLAAFSSSFASLRQVDDELLGLAVRNTNLKASALAQGPLTQASQSLQDALTALAAADSPDRPRVAELATGAELAVLRIQAGLPAHIAEASDAGMDRMEAGMAAQEQEARRDLEALAALPGLAGRPELAAAQAALSRFGELKAEALRLSRENTNVRSLALSLDRWRTAMLGCQQALDELRQAVREEPVETARVARPR